MPTLAPPRMNGVQFPTFVFSLFFLTFLAVWWGVLSPNASSSRRAAVLLGGSLIFYAAADWRWVGVLIGVGLISRWGSAWAVRASDADRKWRLALVVGALVIHLVAWKYSLWLIAERNDLAGLWGARAWALPEWAYPVGLSFFTFHAIALTLAAGRGKVPVPSQLEALTHVAFFPALLAGPVLRADQIIPRLQAPFLWRQVPWLEGIFRIAMGMVFKWVFASQAAQWADPVFSGMAESTGQVWWGIHAYAFQIFFDFAGYSHMALGLAMMLGFRLPENFTQPYVAISFQDFWRRWHRSLSFFFRDHLYIDAFGGNRHGKTIALLSAMATMVISGIWHGASVTFLIWGVWHAGALVVERLLPGRGKWPKALGWLVTFEGVVWGWVCFRAEDWDNMKAVFSQAFGELPWQSATSPVLTWTALAWSAGMIAAVAWERQILVHGSTWATRVDQGQAPGWATPATAMVLAVAAVLIIALGPVGVPPFIYAGF